MNKEFNLVRNIFLSNFKRLNSPYKIIFALTYRCNLRCKICKIWKIPPKKELSINEIEKIFKNLNNLNWLDLTGGEVTLREDLIEVVKVIINNSRRLSIFHISTNGQLPQRVFLLAKQILKYNILPIFNISVDSTRKINDGLKGGEDSYQKSLETFKLLKSLSKGYFYLSCTISNYNIDYIDEFILELKKDILNFSFSDLHFNIFHNSKHYYNNEGIDGLSKIRFDVIKKYLELCKKGNFIKIFLEDEYIKGLSQYLNGNKFPVKCQALESSCFINPYGEVYPCGVYNKFIMDLKECDYNISNIWMSPNTFKIMENKNCYGCWSPCEAYPAILGNIMRSLIGLNSPKRAKRNLS